MEAYQRTNAEREQGMMARADYVAAFFGDVPKRATLIGLYEVGAYEVISDDEYWARQAYQELRSMGMSGPPAGRTNIFEFELARMEAAEKWSGRLTIGWNSERSWARWADRNEFPIEALHEQDQFAEVVPDWREVIVSWNDLAAIPKEWASAIRQWRGVYYVFDQSDGRGYVGSACGAQNILGRWLNYAATGHGDNRHLRARDPQNFLFSILQLTAPDLDANEVVALESSWKRRLHTRTHGLNGN